MQPHTDDDPNAGPGRPRWVTGVLVVALLAVLLLVVLLLAGGEHGPGRHLSEALVGGGALAAAGAGPRP